MVFLNILPWGGGGVSDRGRGMGFQINDFIMQYHL